MPLHSPIFDSWLNGMRRKEIKKILQILFIILKRNKCHLNPGIKLRDKMMPFVKPSCPFHHSMLLLYLLGRLFSATLTLDILSLNNLGI